MTQALTLTLRNTLDEIPRIGQAVEGFFDTHRLPQRACMHLTVALDELATNAISYGFEAGTDRPDAVRVTLELRESEILAMIEDCGKPFDPLSVPEPDTTLAVDERAIGGLGVHFVREFMDEVTYERMDGLNRVRMRKRLADDQQT